MTLTRDPKVWALLIAIQLWWRASHLELDRVLEMLVKAKGELDVFDAAAADRCGRLRELLDADPDAIRQRSPEGFTTLGLAVVYGGPEAVRFLLERGADPDGEIETRSGVRPVHAVRHLETLRLLLEAGADPDARRPDGFTPLHVHALVDRIDLVRLLLDHGADRSLLTDDGRDSRMIAIEGESWRVAALLAG